MVGLHPSCDASSTQCSKWLLSSRENHKKSSILISVSLFVGSFFEYTSDPYASARRLFTQYSKTPCLEALPGFRKSTFRSSQWKIVFFSFWKRMKLFLESFIKYAFLRNCRSISFSQAIS